MHRKTVIAVVGSSGERAERNAYALGALIASRGWVVLTGGRDSGVMAAAAAGAKDPELPAAGLTIGMLPNGHASVAPSIDIAIVTDVNEARNNQIVMTGDVIVACGVDGLGTASEVALALRNDKHVVLLGASTDAVAFFERVMHDRSDQRMLVAVQSPEEAMMRIDDVLAGRAW